MVKGKKKMVKREKLPAFHATSSFSALALPSDETGSSDYDSEKATIALVSSTPIVKSKSHASSAKSPNITKIIHSRVKPKHPDTLSMICEAINAIGNKKGASVQAIKKWIFTKYQVDHSRFKHFFKAAIEKGINNKVIIRPNSSQVSGAVGRLLVTKKIIAKKEDKTKSVKKLQPTPRPKLIEKIRKKSLGHVGTSKVMKKTITPKKTMTSLKQNKIPQKKVNKTKASSDKVTLTHQVKPKQPFKVTSKNKKSVSALISKKKSIERVKNIKPKKKI